MKILDLIKKQLNIDGYFDEDDEYLLYLYEVAKSVVQQHIDISLEKLVVDCGGKMPPAIQQAILIYTTDLYNHRELSEPVKISEVPFNYDYLLSLYKDYRNEKPLRDNRDTSTSCAFCPVVNGEVLDIPKEDENYTKNIEKD